MIDRLVSAIRQSLTPHCKEIVNVRELEFLVKLIRFDPVTLRTYLSVTMRTYGSIDPKTVTLRTYFLESDRLVTYRCTYTARYALQRYILQVCTLQPPSTDELADNESTRAVRIADARRPKSPPEASWQVRAPGPQIWSISQAIVSRRGSSRFSTGSRAHRGSHARSWPLEEESGRSVGPLLYGP